MNLISVEISVANKDLLEQALTALGLKWTAVRDGITIHTPGGNITIVNGKATLEDRAMPWLNKVKRMYSVKTIELVSKKYKFNLTTKSDNKMVLRKY